MTIAMLENPVLSDTATVRRRNRVPPITVNQERMGGTPVIGIYRLQVTTLFDYLIEGHSLDEFLAEFPGTDKEAVTAVLERVCGALDEGWLAEKVDF